MDWTNKNVNPSKVVHIGQEVEVMVLDIDEERRRISLGIKQCQANPWKDFGDNFNRGDKVSGQIKSITDFGIFIGLSGGIDGLVHLSDISWDVPGEEAVRNYQKGQQVEAMVLSIDPERERISLGIKQLAKDPFSTWIAEHPKSTIVKGTVREVDAKGAIIDLGGGVEGHLRASELSRDRVEDARTVLKVDDEVEAKFTNVDRKSRTIALSIKAKEIHEENEAVQNYRTGESSSGTSLGDLLKEHIGGQDNLNGRAQALRRDSQGIAALQPAVRQLRGRTTTGPSMTKSELIELIAAKQKHLPAKDVELAVKQILEIMSDALAQGSRIEIRGFGSFSLHFRPPRQGRNPKTGETVALSGKYVPHFKPGKDLRERVNDGAGSPIRD